MDKLTDYFQKIEKLESDEFMTLVEKYLGDEEIEKFVDHIADFYGIEDDDELGTLAQIMITGYLAALHSHAEKVIH